MEVESKNKSIIDIWGMNKNNCKLQDEESYKQITIFTKYILCARNFYVIETRKNETLILVRKARASDAL